MQIFAPMSLFKEEERETQIGKVTDLKSMIETGSPLTVPTFQGSVSSHAFGGVPNFF